MFLTPYSNINIERCRMLGYLGNGHRVYGLARHLLEIKAVE